MRTTVKTCFKCGAEKPLTDFYVQISQRRNGAAVKATVTFKVEKGVPLPPAMRDARYPFLDMAPGDSFLAPCARAEWKRVRSRVSSAARAFVRAQGSGCKLQFATRCLPEGVRCWRIK